MPGGKKDGQKPKGKKGRRSTADQVQAQGAGKAVARPFGAPKFTRAQLMCWDAFHPSHLPLPRAVGPYTVVRTTTLVTSSDHVNIIGTFRREHSDRNDWSNTVMLSSVLSGSAINAASNARQFTCPFPGVAVAGSGFTCTPSALSVQVMNANPLQTTEGLVAGAVCPTQLDLRGRTETWNDLGNEVISYMRPRLMTAGKLTLRGVQGDSYPLNMSSISEFTSMYLDNDGVVTYDDANAYHPNGWAPIVIINNGHDLNPPLALQYLITVEWRVRFDIGNPAVASHRYHGVASDADWGKMIEAAASKAHGMLDIVERVANMGTSLAKAGSLVSKYV